MQVEHGHDRDVGAYGAAHRLEEIAVGIVGSLRQRRPMGRDEHRVERQHLLEPVLDLFQEVLEEALLDGAARLGLGHAQWDRRPVAAAVHLGEEARQVGEGDGGRRAPLADDLVAADIDVLLKIRRRAHGREAVALDGESQDGDARIVVGHGP
jgi:hypothetical protein